MRGGSSECSRRFVLSISNTIGLNSRKSPSARFCQWYLSVGSRWRRILCSFAWVLSQRHAKQVRLGVMCGFFASGSASNMSANKSSSQASFAMNCARLTSSACVLFRSSSSTSRRSSSSVRKRALAGLSSIMGSILLWFDC